MSAVPVTDLKIEIFERRTGDGRPFAEISYSYTEAGVLRQALSRVWWPLPDTPHQRALEAEQFLHRRARPYG